MKKVTIYSGDPCSFCEAAKALLKTKNVEIEEFDIWKDQQKPKKCYKEQMELKQYLKYLSKITILGGNDKLQDANQSGELDKLSK